MLTDYHWHTNRCGHAEGDMAEYVAQARKRGLTEVGFADHVPMYWLPEGERDPSLAMAGDELPRYVEEVLLLRGGNPDINIRLGLEADYIPGREQQLREIIANYPFDYIIGSVHYIDGWGFDNPGLVYEYENRNIDEIYELYFDQLCRAAGSGIFDIIAHPDLIKKFGYRPDRPPLELYRRAALTLAGSGVCLEVNTAGLRAPVGEIYPARDFLIECGKRGVPVTTGSDAHKPGQVGRGFDLALELLKAAGYREIAAFNKRRRTYIGI